MNYFEPTEEQRQGYDKFVATRPPNVRAVAEKFAPWTLYRMKSSGHRVTLGSFSEHSDGSVSLTVIVSGKYNAVMFERAVFGISPDDLEECDLPLEDEPVGAILSRDEVEENIESIRSLMGLQDNAHHS